MGGELKPSQVAWDLCAGARRLARSKQLQELPGREMGAQ